MSSEPLTQTEIADRLRNENLDEWLELWWATQGTAKRCALELMAAFLPFPIEEKLSVLDFCCGPGDVGRVIRSRFSIARIDCVDRDPFLLSLCAALNTPVGIEGEIFTRDAWKPDWSVCLSKTTASSRLPMLSIGSMLREWRNSSKMSSDCCGPVGLRVSGASIRRSKVLPRDLLNGSSRGRRTVTNPETWEQFWARANAFLGYDHTQLLGTRDSWLIGDDGMPVSEWVRLLESAGFRGCDVLLRSAEKVVVASIKP